ncbi:MAG: 16S rRNA (guanine(527)-N(7))-methyltransferase RsmG [Bacteroidota bacterium]
MKHSQLVTPQQLIDPIVWLRTACAKNGLSLQDDQLKLIGDYVRLLLEWNQKINLISRRDEENVWQSHILHSIAPLFQIKLPESCRIVDLGTGGGLPGIPLRILNPTIRITMVDSTQKKIMAVNEMIKALGIKDTVAVWGRAEELSKRKEFKSQFDVVVARGVGPLDELIRLSHPFLALSGPLAGSTEAPIGCLLAYKGGGLEQEIAKSKLNKTVREIKVRTLSGDGMDPAAGKKLVIVYF